MEDLIRRIDFCGLLKNCKYWPNEYLLKTVLSVIGEVEWGYVCEQARIKNKQK